MSGFRVYSSQTPILPNPVLPKFLVSAVNGRETLTVSYPFAGVNSTGALRYRTWTINLPETYQSPAYPEYVFSITLKGEFTESSITGTGSGGAITRDINTVASYSWFNNMIYDSTWSPQVLPPGSFGSSPPAAIVTITPTTTNYPGNSTASYSGPPPVAATVFTTWFDAPTRTIRIRATLQNNYYISGVFTIQFGDIFPAVSQDFEGYSPSIGGSYST